MEDFNIWSEDIVEKSISQWGVPHHPWTIASFKAAASGGPLICDIGCGFGRFYQWLIKHRKEPFSYVGVDGSEWMIKKCKQLYGCDENHVFFEHDAVESFDFIEVPHIATILCNSVLIHLPFDHQDKVLANIKEASPVKFVLDIETRNGAGNVARLNNEMGKKFYRTWNVKEEFEEKLHSLFDDYEIDVSTFPYGKNLARHVFVALYGNRTKG